MDTILRRLCGCVILVCTIFSAGTIEAREGDDPGLLKIGAWLTYWDLPNGHHAMRAYENLFDVFYFAAQLTDKGEIAFANPKLTNILEARSTGNSNSRYWLTIVNDVSATTTGQTQLKDPHIVHSLLADSDKRTRHINDIVDLARLLGLRGIDIDYENLSIADRGYFTEFSRELARALHRNKLLLSLSVQPKSKDVAWNGAGAMNWRELCEVTDRLQIMLYNQFSGKTGAGPIATPEWISSVLQYAETTCQKNKIIPILKLSGIVWEGEQTRGIQFDEVNILHNNTNAKSFRADVSNVPYIKYKENGKQFTAYYEDSISILTKIKTIHALGYTNIMFWSLGREDPQLPIELNRYLKTKK
ncbi:MAG: glycosyl hydrolase family 18 protein [Pseudomonadota bacterium]